MLFSSGRVAGSEKIVGCCNQLTTGEFHCCLKFQLPIWKIRQVTLFWGITYIWLFGRKTSTAGIHMVLTRREFCGTGPFPYLAGCCTSGVDEQVVFVLCKCVSVLFIRSSSLSVTLWLCVFLFWCSLFLVFAVTASDWLERLVSEVTCNVLMGC